MGRAVARTCHDNHLSRDTKARDFPVGGPLIFSGSSTQRQRTSRCRHEDAARAPAPRPARHTVVLLP